MLLVLPAAVLLVLTGCGAAGVDPDPSPSPTSSVRPPTPTASQSPTDAPIPEDGIGLAAFGIQNGPPQFSVPRGSVASSVVDQPNNVVLVLSAPAPVEVAAYLERNLVRTGFTITDADGDDSTVIFAGYGWTGSFTAGDDASGILLRPR